MEKWTLRDIQAQLRAAAAAGGVSGGGGSSGGSGGATNTTTPPTSTASSSSVLHPPPIPARRNVAGPSTSQSSQQPPQQQQQSSSNQTSASRNTANQESHSAPSSPTESSEKNQASALTVAASSSNRPRSMAVTDGSVKYTTISFAEDSNHEPPNTRRFTAYSDIKHPRALSHEDKNKLTADLNLDADGRPISPSYVSVGVCPNPQDGSSETMYDVPPPPVPLRGGNQEGSTSGAADTPTNELQIQISDPLGADNPFARDPFSGGSNSWSSDPASFYDQPRVATATAQANMHTTLPDGYLEINKSSTSDNTGDSSYEDTNAFLMDIRAKYKDRTPEEVMAHYQGSKSKPSQHAQEDEDEDVAYDLPPDDTRCRTPTNMDEEGQLGSYDFPSALSRYPFKEGSEGERPKSREEPTLHPMQYPSALKLPGQQSTGSGGSVAGNTSSPKLLSKSSADQLPPRSSPRANVPLPPTPMESGDHPEGPPPLPARQISAPGKQSRGPSGGGAGGGGRPGGGGGESSGDRPQLPPFNHPWGNKPQAQAQFDATHPPLPPRKKPQTSNGHEGMEAPNASSAEDSMFQDFINKGYQRADIERALRIAKDNHELAKSILKEFGGRH